MNISERVKHSEFLSPILEREKMTEAELLQGLAAGSIVIPWNPRHKNLKPVAIGKGATTKVSASIGMYSPEDTPEKEMEKLKAADEVAYVRFASVYRQFKDINTFMSELNKLLNEK